jgi:prevent-host-death family protein
MMSQHSLDWGQDWDKPMPEQVSVKQLRDRASEIVRAAESGQEVTITRRGRPVAQVVKLPQNQTEAVLDIRQRWHGRKPPRPQQRYQLPEGELPFADSLIAERQ